MTREDFIEEVTKTTKKYNHTIGDDEDSLALLSEVVKETVDRLSLYLNLQPDDEFDARLVGVASRIVSGIFNQTSANVDNAGGPEMAVSGISDNGQSISYSSDRVRTYLSTADDDEIFGGCAALLKPYRKFNVVS